MTEYEEICRIQLRRVLKNSSTVSLLDRTELVLDISDPSYCFLVRSSAPPPEVLLRLQYGGFRIRLNTADEGTGEINIAVQGRNGNSLRRDCTDSLGY
jgi:hypothetical protein